jgi:hypothetical protein
MKKVISFSLWGSDPKYTIGAIKNAILCNKIYTGWISRFYCGTSVPDIIIKQLKDIDNTEVIIMEESGNYISTFWRFNSIIDNDIILIRDTDSRLNLREKAAVDEWLNSDKSSHIMRDHPYHKNYIMAGMFGVKNNILKNIDVLMSSYDKKNFYLVDEYFLRDIIYPIIKDDVMVHDEFFNYEPFRKPFPIARIGQEFVGEAFDYLDNPNHQHRSMIKKNK